jgi:hypothetical protein
LTFCNKSQKRLKLGSKEDAKGLVAAVSELRGWLEAQIKVEVWFPSINTNVVLELQRRDFVTICGNISKHNLSRLTRNAKRLKKLLQKNGIMLDWIDALRTLDDFQGRFHDDILVYHSTTLAEMLNNVRWTIHEYLKPEFTRSYTPAPTDDDPKYSYRYPDFLVHPFARDRYWDLMNQVRARPWIDRFTGTRYLKGRY